MKQLMKFTSAALILTAVSMGGCVTVGTSGGTGTYAYVTGTLKCDIDAKLDRAYEASQRAIKALEFREVSKGKDALQALVDAKMADDSSVSIRLKKRTDATTEVTVRVGAFGDEKKSIIIMDEIKKAL